MTVLKKGFGLIVGELRASLVSPGIIREGRRNPRRHSHSANLLKMRQVYNWLYLAGLIAILCINLSSQEPDRNLASGTCSDSLTKVVEFHNDLLTLTTRASLL